ncbi:MAG: hypothetical protein GVY26_07745, partial [Bacteroidetes bacterium]|nr:hypothetical protein [Bacteroidota bacterium]
MSKRQQLTQMEQLGLPMPAFRAVGYEAWQSGQWDSGNLQPPFIVRSSYTDEDGHEASMAGQFKSILPVQPEGLSEALKEVFRSYPVPAGSEAIIQELIEPDYSGVLFAFREGCWKVELAEGQGEALMSGRADAKSLLLPHFSKADSRMYMLWRFWKAWPQA